MSNHSQFLYKEPPPIPESWSLIVEYLIIPYHPNAPAARIIISEEKGTFSFILTSAKASRTDRFLSLVGQMMSQHS
jgi:hypothetical protein